VPAGVVGGTYPSPGTYTWLVGSGCVAADGEVAGTRGRVRTRLRTRGGVGLAVAGDEADEGCGGADSAGSSSIGSSSGEGDGSEGAVSSGRVAAGPVTTSFGLDDHRHADEGRDDPSS
jgi:hypothetical protein